MREEIEQLFGYAEIAEAIDDQRYVVEHVASTHGVVPIGAFRGSLVFRTDQARSIAKTVRSLTTDERRAIRRDTLATLQKELS